MKLNLLLTLMALLRIQQFIEVSSASPQSPKAIGQKLAFRDGGQKNSTTTATVADPSSEIAVAESSSFASASAASSSDDDARDRDDDDLEEDDARRQRDRSTNRPASRRVYPRPKNPKDSDAEDDNVRNERPFTTSGSRRGTRDRYDSRESSSHSHADDEDDDRDRRYEPRRGDDDFDRDSDFSSMFEPMLDIFSHMPGYPRDDEFRGSGSRAYASSSVSSSSRPDGTYQSVGSVVNNGRARGFVSETGRDGRTRTRWIGDNGDNDDRDQ
ncbi:hypothetical protein GZH46_01124 [Fragariocoptes setiger]|uniref:Uncharacterized protein n=1 Tax=Fragariocoptes setiger TaxID=1670756 RepID=A0ABQ7SAD8_9ACAR|nr:hypothetical protein GZH46_01124 [Fragariocoptes setiger]